MERARDRLPPGIRAVSFRQGLAAPGIQRATEFLRLFSYGCGIVAGPLIDVTAFQRVAIIAPGVIMSLLTIRRLAVRDASAPYVIAQVDLAVSGLAIALATAAPAVVLLVDVLISVALATTFNAPRRTAIGMSVLWTGPHVAIAAALAQYRSEDASITAPLYAVVVTLSLVGLLLVGFRMRTQQLRNTLHHRGTQLRAVLASAPVLLASIGLDGEITTLAGSVVDWPSGEELLATPEIREIIAEARSGSPVTREVVMDDRALNLTCDPHADGTLLLTAFDSTSATLARERLEALIRSKDRFIAAVSHELRTPLAAVLGYSEIVHDSMDPDSELRPMVGEVVSQSSEMAALIDDLLVAARASIGTVATERRHIDLTTELRSVAAAIGTRLNTVPELETQDRVDAFADPIRVRQIIRNLLTNADRYGGDSIVVRTHSDGGSAILEVRDNGAPIPESRQRRMWEPYETSGPVRGAPAAIGLGLAVSRTLAELMGGAVTYRHDGEWSVFELRLPSLLPALERSRLA